MGLRSINRTQRSSRQDPVRKHCSPPGEEQLAVPVQGRGVVHRLALRDVFVKKPSIHIEGGRGSNGRRSGVPSKLLAMGEPGSSSRQAQSFTDGGPRHRRQPTRRKEGGLAPVALHAEAVPHPPLTSVNGPHGRYTEHVKKGGKLTTTHLRLIRCRKPRCSRIHSSEGGTVTLGETGASSHLSKATIWKHKPSRADSDSARLVECCLSSIGNMPPK
ncbi:hypothetical protein LZ31DRAFT_92418 [Colletotrichum somersetense]|nr:hypothetical protein LZ31DRAFT_92418 [Colletotrichum somersetense]